MQVMKYVVKAEVQDGYYNCDLQNAMPLCSGNMLQFVNIMRTKYANYICTFVSPCVGGSKAPPRTIFCIKCMLAEQFIQTANYCKKSISHFL